LQRLLHWSLLRSRWRLAAAVAGLAAAAEEASHEKQACHEAGRKAHAPEHEKPPSVCPADMTPMHGRTVNVARRAASAAGDTL
jgi:hypothetical protein